MNVARPLSKEDYEAYYKELYNSGGDNSDGELTVSYTVALDDDPTVNLKSLASKLSMVQGFKDRVMIILNDSIKNEAYWNVMSKKLDSVWQGEISRSLLDAEVSKGKSKETREALASKMSNEKLSEGLKGGVLFTDKIQTVRERLADARAFLKEVEHIFDNLDSTDQNLVRQLKTVMISAKVIGLEQDADPENVKLSVQR